MEEIILPKPLRNDLFVANPVFGQENLIKELKHIPEAKQADYIKNNLSPLFERVTVHSIGGNVTSCAAGDEVFMLPGATVDGISFMEGRFILISERNVTAVW